MPSGRGGARGSGGGWIGAAAWAAATLATIGVLGEVLAMLVYAAGTGERTSIANFLRLGAFLMYAFHRVALVLDGTAGSTGIQGFGVGSDVLVVLAPLAGTILALLLLARGGRALADAAGGSGAARLLHGAKIAIPYGVLAGALSWAVTIPAGDLARGSPRVHPDHLMAFLWPLVLALVAGLVGGFRSAVDAGPAADDAPTSDAADGAPAPGDATMPRGDRVRPRRTALAGGAWTLGLGLVLSFAGLVLLAPFNPEATRTYFAPFDRSLGQGLAVVVFTLIVLPNVSLMVLTAGMGACQTIVGAVGDTSFSYCLLSYTNFPRGGSLAAALIGGQVPGVSPRIDLPGPPAGYALFVLAPLVAVLAGGAVAARRAGVSTRAEAARAGAMGGTVFAALVALGAILAAAGLEVAARVGVPRLAVRAGPDLAQSFVLALVWGVVGGAVGGVMGFRRPRPPSTDPGG